MNLRKEKERLIHNNFFSEHTRGKVSFFYLITENSSSFYQNLLIKNCFEKKVLDYGCGTGNQSLFLARNGAKVTGIDISEEGIKQAIKKNETKYKDIENKVNFLVMDAEKMTFPDNVFDVICGTGILHHLNLDLAFKEIRRVLKPRGKGFFIEPLGYNPIINIFRKITPNLRTPDEHPFLIKDIKNAYNYFDEVNLYFFHLFSFLAIPFKNTIVFEPFLKRLHTVDQFFFRMIPPLRWMAWMVIIVLSKPKRK
ncbi:hypothetical protein AMJ49_05350 [Parcubacteria bacterium DG_74_2]|nr:MAG: hypothetical protein AMJ49_05350 [Parcubacteria bacterium DG_74_2]